MIKPIDRQISEKTHNHNLEILKLVISELHGKNTEDYKYYFHKEFDGKINGGINGFNECEHAISMIVITDKNNEAKKLQYSYNVSRECEGPMYRWEKHTFVRERAEVEKDDAQFPQFLDYFIQEFHDMFPNKAKKLLPKRASIRKQGL